MTVWQFFASPVVTWCGAWLGVAIQLVIFLRGFRFVRRHQRRVVKHYKLVRGYFHKLNARNAALTKREMILAAKLQALGMVIEIEEMKDFTPNEPPPTRH